MNTAPLTRRLLNTFDRACEDTIAQGVAWYPLARRTCENISREYGVPVDTVARVVAVLSPNMSWKGNITCTRKVLDGWTAGIPASDVRAGLRTNVRKAYAILNGNPDALTGPKVTNFYRNIMGESDLVTVDSWAMRAATGKPYTNRDVPTATERAAITLAYCRAAARRGVCPRDFQAIVWVVIRGRAD